MRNKSLRDLFVDELKDVYDAESRLTKALPKMIKAAHSNTLTGVIEKHLQQTERHLTRLDRVFEALDEAPVRKTCKAMVGLLAEAQELLAEEGSPNMQDLALIAAAQKVEHYEIATYSSLRCWADKLGEPLASKLLQQTLDEETAADAKLSDIAMAIDADAMDEEPARAGKSAARVVATGSKK